VSNIADIEAIILYGYESKPPTGQFYTFSCGFPECRSGDVLYIDAGAYNDADKLAELIEKVREDDDRPEIEFMCVSHMADLRDRKNAIIGHPTIEFALRQAKAAL
jgi:hypothetical protein